MDIWQKRRWHQFSTYTRLILLATLIINTLAFFLIWLLEANNPATLGNLSLSDAGRVVVIFLMIAGRLGPLTLAYLVARPHKSHIRYADARLQIG